MYLAVEMEQFGRIPNCGEVGISEQDSTCIHYNFSFYNELVLFLHLEVVLCTPHVLSTLSKTRL
jgi:hypothetical protein